MARARNIKPSFFINEELVELPFSTRLLFIGLWTIADREGRLEDKPKKIKMALFPADNLDIDEAINELQSGGFVKRYTIEENQYIQILAFKKHQNPHIKEPASTIPAPCEHQTSTVPAVLIPDSLLPITDSPLLKQTPEQKTIARVCQIFKDNNIQGFSSIHPVFQELIKQGVTADEFEFAAKNHQGKKFNYICGVIKNTRLEAASIRLAPKEDKHQWLRNLK